MAHKDGFAPAAAVVEEGKAVDLVLVPGALREFLLVDANAKPVPDATLTYANVMRAKGPLIPK